MLVSFVFSISSCANVSSIAGSHLQHTNGVFWCVCLLRIEVLVFPFPALLEVPSDTSQFHVRA